MCDVKFYVACAGISYGVSDVTCHDMFHVACSIVYHIASYVILCVMSIVMCCEMLYDILRVMCHAFALGIPSSKIKYNPSTSWSDPHEYTVSCIP